MKHALPHDVELNLTMEHCLQAITMESALLENILGVIKKYLPGLSNGFKEKVSVLADASLQQPEELPQNLKKVSIVLQSVNYTTLEKIQVNVHEGFDSKLLHAIPVLNALIDHFKYVEKLSSDYRAFLSTLISNKDSRLSVKTQQALYKASDKLMEELNGNLKDIYKAKSYTTKRDFVDMFDRNSDAEKFLVAMDSIQRKLNTVSLKDMRAGVDVCATYLDMFIESIKSGTIDNVSNEVIKDIAAGSYQIAKEAEFVAANYYRITAFIATANSLNEKLLSLKLI